MLSKKKRETTRTKPSERHLCFIAREKQYGYEEIERNLDYKASERRTKVL